MSEDTYPFRIINADNDEVWQDGSILLKRPFAAIGNSFAEDAKRFVPGQELETAINTAIAVGEPLLITGEPGTGKTQAAYYAAYKLGIEPVLHFQVKSDSSGNDLLYHFDTVRYFHDATIKDKGVDGRTTEADKKPDGTTTRPAGNEGGGDSGKLNKKDYVEPRLFWDAIDSSHPRVLLIDEIDKAPRDFPNDLLHELDKMKFTVTETGESISASKEKRPIVFITSNSERRLPEPFLRRCAYHHIRFDDELIAKAVKNRSAEYQNLDQSFLDLAVKRFIALRNRSLPKRPSTGELLVWLRVLALSVGTYSEHLDANLSKLPYLGVLLKDHQDIEELGAQR